jgi:quinol monooxygenase YgiN
VVEQSRAEDGNVAYRLFEEVDQPNVYLTMEQWADLWGIESHKIRSHFNEFVKSIQGCLIEPLEIQIISVPDSTL